MVLDAFEQMKMLWKRLNDQMSLKDLELVGQICFYFSCDDSMHGIQKAEQVQYPGNCSFPVRAVVPKHFTVFFGLLMCAF